MLSCATCTDSGPSRAARRASSATGSAKKRHQSNEDLVRRFVEACRRTRTILPATTTIERLCADALVDAERRIEARIAERVPPGLRRDLEHLLDETVDAGVTRFVWLRQFEPGSNSAAANRLLDRLEHLRRLDVPEGLFHDICMLGDWLVVNQVLPVNPAVAVRGPKHIVTKGSTPVLWLTRRERFGHDPKRRAAGADLPPSTCCSNGGTLEHAQQITGLVETWIGISRSSVV